METPQLQCRGVSTLGQRSLTGRTRGLEQEGGQNQNAPSMPDGGNRADTGDESDKAAVPKEHEGPRNDESDDGNEDDESNEDGQAADDFLEHSSSHFVWCLVLGIERFVQSLVTEHSRVGCGSD